MAIAALETTDTNFNQTVTALVRRQIDENLRNRAVYLAAGEPVRGTIIPGTNLIRHIAYTDLTVTTNNNTVAAGTAPWLTEGVMPTEEAFAIEFEEYGASQAGRIIAITDVALAESPHELMSVAAEKIGVNAALTVDLWIANSLHAGAASGHVLMAGTPPVANRAAIVAGTTLNASNIRRAVSTLKSLNIPPFSDGMYRAFINPLVSHDLMAEVAAGGWLDVARYVDPNSILTGEVGRFAGCRFIETNVGTGVVLGAAGVDIFSTYVCGPGSFAFGDLQTIRAYMVSPGGDHTDVLAQKADVGWKAMFGSKLLVNPSSGLRYVRIESASSLGNNA